MKDKQKEQEKLYEKACRLYEQEKLTASYNTYKKLITEYPTNGRYVLAFIEYFLFTEDWMIETEGENYKEIIALCRATRKEIPKEEHYYFYLHEAQAHIDYIDYTGEAITDEKKDPIPELYEKAIQLYPVIPEAYLKLITYYSIPKGDELTEEHHEAIEALISALPTDIKNNLLVKIEISNYYAINRKYEEAIKEELEIEEMLNETSDIEDDLKETYKELNYYFLSINYKAIGDTEKYLHYKNLTHF